MEHLYIVLYNSHCVNISDNNYSAIKNNFKIRNFWGLRNEKYINYLKFTQKKISALAIFPNESSWGSIYAIIGGAILTVGIYFRIKSVLVKRISRILSVVGCVIVLFGIFTVSDYIAVSQFQQVPRFSYEKSYGEDIVEHKTLFYTVIQKNPGTSNESIKIAK